MSGASRKPAPILPAKMVSSVISVGHGVGPKDETGGVDKREIGLPVGGWGNTSSVVPRTSSFSIVGDEVKGARVVDELIGALVSSIPWIVGDLVEDAVGALVVVVAEIVGEMVGALGVGALVVVVAATVGEMVGALGVGALVVVVAEIVGEMVGALGGFVSVGLFS
jgi:hypothetical protein